MVLQNPSELRRFISYSLKRYEELTGKGLPCASPPAPPEDVTVTIPGFHSGGGMSFGELVILGRVTKSLKPKTIFEMGTYNGLTTAVFLLNSNPTARVITLDLPENSVASEAELRGDLELITSRNVALVPSILKLRPHTQLLCDSMDFDPTPYLNSVDLGLIDAAHDAAHVENDTLKMSRMLSNDGIVFWHDYGGKGVLRPLAYYLETLARSFPIFRIRDTSLAWARAERLKEALGRRTASLH